ncbi:hypothetical protein GCM10009678_08340 [Actinomadura kijaniata]
MELGQHRIALRQGLGAHPDLHRQPGAEVGGRVRGLHRRPHVPRDRVGREGVQRNGVRLDGHDRAGAEIDDRPEGRPRRNQGIYGC